MTHYLMTPPRPRQVPENMLQGADPAPPKAAAPAPRPAHQEQQDEENDIDMVALNPQPNNMVQVENMGQPEEYMMIDEVQLMVQDNMDNPDPQPVLVEGMVNKSSPSPRTKSMKENIVNTPSPNSIDKSIIIEDGPITVLDFDDIQTPPSPITPKTTSTSCSPPNSEDSGKTRGSIGASIYKPGAVKKTGSDFELESPVKSDASSWDSVAGRIRKRKAHQEANEQGCAKLLKSLEQRSNSHRQNQSPEDKGKGASSDQMATCSGKPPLTFKVEKKRNMGESFSLSSGARKKPRSNRSGSGSHSVHEYFDKSV